MPTEHEELQEILGANEVPTRKGREQPDQASKLSDPSKLGSFEQWVVEPNETYAPAGASIHKLPAGAYRIDLDDHGRVHLVKMNLVSDNLIDLEDSATNRVIGGIRTFWNRRDRYTKRGILFKRGILLWGPAGSGKTVTLYFLMRELIAMDGIVLINQNPEWLSLALQQLRRIEPERALITASEDVDEIIEKNGEHSLLAVLDGENQVGNIVNIATTNYPERLGQRIINRPSRFDEVIKIGMPSANSRRMYLEHILKEEDSINITNWVEDTEGMSIAHLRELVVAVTCLSQPYEEVINRLKKMKIIPKSSSYEAPPGFQQGREVAEIKVGWVAKK